MRKIEGLQVLRGVAALMIVVLHALLNRGPSSEDPASLATSPLHAGVDLFFVISGVVMAVILFRGDAAFSPVDFLRRRLNRIVPLYWLCTLAVVAAGLLVPDAFQHRLALLNTTSVVRSLLFIPAESTASHLPDPILFPGWTLTYEMFFYLCLACFYRGHPVAALWGFTLVYGVLALLTSLMPSGITWIDVAIDPVKLEFIAGLWLGWLYVSDIRARVPWAWGAIACGSVLGWVAGDSMVAPEWRFIYWGLPASLVVTGVLGIRLTWNSPAAAALIWLGDASYSLYLTHVITVKAFVRCTWGFIQLLPAWLSILIAVSVSIAAAGIVHAVIERPLLKWMNRKTACWRSSLTNHA